MYENINGHQRLFSYLMFLLPVFIEMAHVPGHLAIVSLIYVLIFLYYSRDYRFRKIAVSAPLMIWLTLTVYHFINAIMKKVPDVDTIDLLHGLKIYSCIVIFVYWACNDIEKTVSILINCFLWRGLFTLIEFLLVRDVNDTGRMVTSIGSSTAIGQFAAITIVFIMIYVSIKDISWGKIIKLSSLPLVLIVLTQTRNCLAMSIFAFIGMYILKSKRKSIPLAFSTVFLFIIAIVVMSLASNIFADSAFGQRIIEKANEEGGYYADMYATGTIFDKIVGDRLIYYMRGWLFFVESPITGIGMWMYKPLSGGNYPLHTEYMVQLCEGGLIAAILWVSFILMVFYFVQKNVNETYLKISATIAVLINLFCALYAREFFYEIFYPTYGIALSLSIKEKPNID